MPHQSRLHPFFFLFFENKFYQKFKNNIKTNVNTKWREQRKKMGEKSAPRKNKKKYDVVLMIRKKRDIGKM